LHDNPGSADEAKTAVRSLQDKQNMLLIGPAATETALKKAPLARFGTVHLAVHGLANSATPDRASLVLLADAARGEDGFLQLAEVAQLALRAQTVVLSACETAVGPLNGQEGVANLSRAFLLAGAQSVISTLWPVDDRLSPFLMKRFYSHLARTRSAAYALRRAKLDLIRTFGEKAVPYYWAGFVFEGVPEGATTLDAAARERRHITATAN
jgi:CHAT domain-containing protein